MKFFLKVISYIFHPLYIPFTGTFLYFLITPKYNPLELQSGNVLPIFILTIIVPIISYLILRNLGLVHSISMSTTQERKYPLFVIIALLLMIVYKITPNELTVELHYFFIGLIAGSLASLILLFLNFKSSMHLMGMGSLFMFLTCLSIHFKINLTLALSLIIFAIGLVTSARLYFRAHSLPEILIGFFVGLTTQLLTVKFWLE